MDKITFSTEEKQNALVNWFNQNLFAQPYIKALSDDLIRTEKISELKISTEPRNQQTHRVICDILGIDYDEWFTWANEFHVQRIVQVINAVHWWYSPVKGKVNIGFVTYKDAEEKLLNQL